MKDLPSGRNHLAALFDVCRWTVEFEDPINKVWVQFGFDGGGMCYELIAPLDDTSPVYRALVAGSPILNHVAYRVDSLETEIGRLRQHGCLPIGRANAAIAYEGRRIQFLMSPMKFLFELIEAPHHRHQVS